MYICVIMKKLLLFTLVIAFAATSCTTPLRFVVGTYGDEIYTLEYADGAFTVIDSTAAVNASYLAFDSDGRMFGVCENDPVSGLYAFDTGEGAPYFCTSDALSPCHLLCPEGTPYIFTADYGSGSITVYRKLDDGTVRQTQSVRYPEGSRIHQLTPIPGTSSMLATDLGLCCIHILDIGDGDEPLTDRPELAVPCAGGPRHIVFDGERRFWCLSELSGEIAGFDISIEDGELHLSELFRVMADPNDAHGSADIRILGRTLYASHRLSGDGISYWKIRENGTLEPLGYLSTGAHPRCIVILDGILFAACRDSSTVEAYSLDPATGEPGPLLASIHLSSHPVCLLPRK